MMMRNTLADLKRTLPRLETTNALPVDAASTVHEFDQRMEHQAVDSQNKLDAAISSLAEATEQIATTHTATAMAEIAAQMSRTNESLSTQLLKAETQVEDLAQEHASLSQRVDEVARQDRSLLRCPEWRRNSPLCCRFQRRFGRVLRARHTCRCCRSFDICSRSS